MSRSINGYSRICGVLVTVLLLVLLSISISVNVIQPGVAASERPSESHTWVQTYRHNGASTFGFDSVEQTHDGGFVMVSPSVANSPNVSASGLVVMKTNAAGVIEWQKAYAPADYLPPAWQTYSLEGEVILTMDGGYAILSVAYAFSEHILPYQQTYGWLLKLDHKGKVEWSTIYQPCLEFRPGGKPFTNVPSGVQTSDGGFLLGSSGCYNLGSDNYDAWLMKLDVKGNIVWLKMFVNTDINSVDRSNDGGFILAGSTQPTPYVKVPWILKLDSNRNVEWEKTYDFSIKNYVPPNIEDRWYAPFIQQQEAASAHQTSEGGYIVVGERSVLGDFSHHALQSEVLIFSLDSGGSMLWQKEYNGSVMPVYRLWSQRHSVQQTSDNGFIIAGGLLAPWLLKLDVKGNLVWQRIYEGGSAEFSQARGTSDGNIIAVGVVHGTQWSALALKLDVNGNLRGCSKGAQANATLTDTSVTTINSEVAVVTSSNGAHAISTNVNATKTSYNTHSQCQPQSREGRDDDHDLSQRRAIPT